MAPAGSQAQPTLPSLLAAAAGSGEMLLGFRASYSRAGKVYRASAGGVRFGSSLGSADPALDPAARHAASAARPHAASRQQGYTGYALPAAADTSSPLTMCGVTPGGRGNYVPSVNLLHMVGPSCERVSCFAVPYIEVLQVLTTMSVVGVSCSGQSK